MNRLTRHTLLAAMALGALLSHAGTYTETFDVGAAWYKTGGAGGMDDLNAKGYTNGMTGPFADHFSSDLARRATNVTHSSPYAWQLGDGAHWFRYQCTVSVTRFSVWLARAAGSSPDLQIRWSNNAGASYTLLYHGSELLAPSPENTYTQYVSPVLDISPRNNSAIYLEVNKLLGASIFVDDMAIEYVDPPASLVWLVAPAPAVTTTVGAPITFVSESLSDGEAQIGYGRSPANAGWTWLDGEVTAAQIGYIATNRLWLMPGLWYYAARWILHGGATTNYAWDDRGQFNQQVLTQAVYTAFITNDAWSSVWDFGVADSTTPAQDVTGAYSSIELAQGLSSNIPGNGTLYVEGFPAARAEESNVVSWTHRVNRMQLGFFCMARRSIEGVQTVDLEYSSNGVAWHSWISGATLEQTNAWYMLGGRVGAFDTMETIHVRAIGYDTAGAGLEFGGMQFAVVIPECPWDGMLAVIGWLGARSRRWIHPCGRGLV